MFVIVYALAVSLFAGAEPGEAKGPCAKARELYEALSLERAVEVADEGLTQSPDQLGCLEVKALALLVLGQMDRAKVTLEDLFTRSPDYAIDDPSLSPVLHETIRQIRDSVRPIQTKVQARWILREELRVDFVLEGGIRDASKIRYSLESVPAVERRSGEVPLLGRTATATVAVNKATQISKLKISGSVLNREGRLLARFESEVGLFDRPKEPEPEIVESSGIQWPVWVGIGLAVVGAGVAIAIFAQPKLPDTSGTQGRVGVP